MLQIQNNDNQEKQAVLNKYIGSAQSHYLITQCEAVRNFMHHYHHEIHSEDYHLFINNFPQELDDEFRNVSEVSPYDTGYQATRDLFFEVFAYLFRYLEAITCSKAQRFFQRFLKYIKSYDVLVSFNVDPLMDSLEKCLSYKPNKVLFINENGMYNFYNYFKEHMTNLSLKFWRFCLKIFQSDYLDTSSLCPVKLTENVNKIMRVYSSINHDDVGWLLFTFIGMIHHLKLLQKIEFDVVRFYDCAKSIIRLMIQKTDDDIFLPIVSNILSCILNGSRNTILIDNLDKLILFSSIFAFDLTRILRRAVINSDIFKINKNKRQRFTIIYLILIALPTIEHDRAPLLRQLLFELHSGLQKYIQMPSIEDYSFKSKLLLTQLFIKSQATLGIPTTSRDHAKLNDVLETFPRTLALNLHYSYLSSHYLTDVVDLCKRRELDLILFFIQINNLLRILITTLSDVNYSISLQTYPYLFMNDDLTKNQSSQIIPKDFLERLWTGCELHLLNTFSNDRTEIFKNPEYQSIKNIMANILCLFKTFKNLRRKNALSITEMLDLDLHPRFRCNCLSDCIGSRRDAQHFNNLSLRTDELSRLSIEALLRWFTLMYEVKIMFGGQIYHLVEQSD